MPLLQMRGRITEALREPLSKLYESHHAAPHFEEPHAMWGIADYSVSDLSTWGEGQGRRFAIYCTMISVRLQDATMSIIVYLKFI